MVECIIVDDEEKGRGNLRSLLNEYCKSVEVVGEADSAVKGVEIIKELKPDLVFLDIEMPGGSGFDLLNQFKEMHFSVIFTTAYSQYAVKAFKFSAIDYLLKPINILELQEAVKKFEEQKGTKHSGVEMLHTSRIYSCSNKTLGEDYIAILQTHIYALLIPYFNLRMNYFHEAL